MAGTQVRYSRESFAATAASSAQVRRRFAALSEADVLLGLFVLIQIAEYVILGVRDILDLPLAACLSASLIAVARLYAAHRSDAPHIAKSEWRGKTHERTVTEATVEVSAVATAEISSAPAEGWADLMARISHEIRTPLNAVIGFSDLMEREIFGTLGHPRYADYAAHIKDSGEALLKSAEDTLALSQLLATPQASERLQVTELATLPADAWRALELHASRRNITLEAVIPGGIAVSGDRRACRQAILNLMTEALHRAADGSAIEVDVRTDNDVARLTISVPQTGPWRREAIPTLAICIARTLLERLGTSLVTTEDRANCSWQAVTLLSLSVQDDFFRQEPR